MRPYTKKRARLNRQAEPARAAFRGEFHLCMNCCRRLAEECRDIHEIARGPNREEALKHRCAWLLLCRGCHDEMDDYSVWPLARQLALKLLADPGHFSLEEFNLIRGRAPTAITLADIVPFLNLRERK